MCVVEGSLLLVGHLIGGGSSGRLGIVCKAVGAGQIGDLAFCEIELVGRSHSIAAALVGLVVDAVGCNGVDFRIGNGVGIIVRADDIVASFQHIAAVGLVIIGSQLLHRDGELDGLGCAGCQLRGLGEVQQVCGSLLDAAVGVGRIAVNFYNILARHSAGVGDSNAEVQVGAVGGDAAHLLGEGGVAQAIAEGVDHFFVVVDETLGGGSFVELVAHVDAFHVVDEGRGGAFRIKEGGIGIQLLGVGVLEVAEVVPPGRILQVGNIGIHGTAGGVDLAGNDLAEALKAGLAGAGAEQDALDLGVILQEVHLEGVGAVVDQNDVVEVCGDQVEQVFLTVGQLQEVVALIPVVALVQRVVVGTVVVSGAALRTVSLCHAADPAAIHNGSHIGGQICALAADTGDDDHCGIRECFCVLHHLIGVQTDIGLRQGPVLRRYANAGAVCLVVGVELAQFLVGLDAGIVQAGQQIGDGVSGVQRTGTGAAVAGVGGSPAENVQLGAGSHRQDAVFVLCQNDTVCGDLIHQLGGLCRGLLADGAAAGHQIQHGGHGAGADQVDNDGQCQQNGKARLCTDHLFLCFGQFAHRDHHNDRQCKHYTKRDEVPTNIRKDLHHVIHIDGQHSFLLLVLSNRTTAGTPPPAWLYDTRS